MPPMLDGNAATITCHSSAKVRVDKDGREWTGRG
jgi:hypothetical protein